MHPVNPAKERIIHIVNQWLIRSGLSIEQVLARMQISGYDITRNTFENRFTTRVQQKPNIPPDCFIALITAFTERLTDAERCTAAEAIELANLARLPIDQFQGIQKLFPPDEFIAAFERFISPLFGKNYLIQDGSGAERPATDQDQPRFRSAAGKDLLEANKHNGSQPSTVDIDLLATEEWGESPEIASFYGRQDELERLIRWIEEDKCRLIALLGMGGMGKTTLAKRVAENVRSQFDFLYWRSLRNAPSFGEVINECIHFLSSEEEFDPAAPAAKRISILLRLLRRYRCLLIFDGAEAIFQEGSESGSYLVGYEDYQELFRRIGETPHKSCSILTSREKPNEFALMEDAAAPVRSLSLTGLSMNSARQTLHDKGLYGEDKTWEHFVSGYSGNPLALKLASEPISEIYGGDIAAFLKGSVPIFTGVRELLDTQFSRLTLLERSVLYWLAIEREATTPDTLLRNLSGSAKETDLLEALRGLRRRSLIEQNSAGLTLQHVVMEYMTERFVALVVDEIEAEFPMLLTSFALMKAGAKEYIRKSQIQLIVEPTLENLCRKMLPEQLHGVLLRMLNTVQNQQKWANERDMPSAVGPTYTAGNLLNLLIHLGPHLENFSLDGLDLSGLLIQHADLRGVTLQDVNLSGSDCTNSVFTETFGSVTTAEFRPGGDLLALGDVGGAVRIWDVATRRQHNTLIGHTDLVWDVTFSPNGNLLASCSEDKTIRLWDVYSGDCVDVLQGHTGWVKSVAFNHSGTLLASCSNDGTVRIWDFLKGICIKTIQAHEHWVWCVAFYPDDRYLASAGHDGLVKVWNRESGECIQILRGHEGPVCAICVSPDGRWLASAGFDHTVQLRELGTEKIRTLSGHENQVWTIAFSPDSQILASGGDDQTIRLWRMDNHNPLRVLRGSLNRVWTVAFSADSRTLVSGSDDQTLRFWDVASGRATQILEGYSNQIWSLDFLAEQQVLATSGDDKRIYLWRTEKANEGAPLVSTTLAGHTDRVRSTAFSAGGEMLVSGGDDHTVRLWSLHNKQDTRLLRGHSNRVWSVAISPDERTVASGSEDQTIRLWRIPSGRCFRILHGTERIWSVAFSPDSQLLVSASDESVIRLWNIKNGTCVSTMEGHRGRVWSVCFSADGTQIISGGDDGQIRTWDLSTGECVRTLEGHLDLVLDISCSPCNRYIASGSEDKSICVWDYHSGECLASFVAHDGSVRRVVFGDGGTLFSGGSDEFVRQWNWQSGECLLEFRADRPYERMNISNVTGLSLAQLDTLRLLGAVEDSR